MEIQQLNVTVRDLYDGYSNDHYGTVSGYHGRLDIPDNERPYKDTQRDTVAHAALEGFPMAATYWRKTGVNDNGEETYQMLVGGPQTMSLCDYVNSDYHIDDDLFFHNLPKDTRDKILDYELLVYVCDGTDEEVLNWLHTINTQVPRRSRLA